jgi:hypothetical protein
METLTLMPHRAQFKPTPENPLPLPRSAVSCLHLWRHPHCYPAIPHPSSSLPEPENFFNPGNDCTLIEGEGVYLKKELPGPRM